MVNFENLDKYIFPGVGKYGIPQIHGVTTQPRGEFIPMNYAMTEQCPEEKNLHCFVDDYQFTRWWNSPDRYVRRTPQGSDSFRHMAIGISIISISKAGFDKFLMAHIRVRNTKMGDKYYGHTISKVDDIKIEPSARASVPGEAPAVQSVNAIDGSGESVLQREGKVNPLDESERYKKTEGSTDTGYNASETADPAHNARSVPPSEPSLVDSVPQSGEEVKRIKTEPSARASVPGEAPAVQSVNAIDGSGDSVPQSGAEVKPTARQPRVAEVTAEGNIVMPRGGDTGEFYLPTAEQERVMRQAAKAQTETERTGILAGASEKAIAQAQRLGEVIGREVVFYSEASDSLGNLRNGFYDPGDGRIYVNTQSDNPLPQIVAHELTHSLEESGSYRDLERLVLKRLQQQGSLDALRQAYRELYARSGVELDTAGVDREIVAAYVEKKLLTDEGEIRSIVTGNRTLGQRILTFLNQLLGKLGNEAAAERAFLLKARSIYEAALEESQAGAEELSRKNANRRGMEELREQLRRGEISEEEAEAHFNDLYDPEEDLERRERGVKSSIETKKEFSATAANKNVLSDIQENSYVEEAHPKISGSSAENGNGQRGFSTSEDSIFSEVENVKQYSISRDSQGRKLSEGQREFFKDSKVVDEEGRLLVVYHGTDDRFTVFDTAESRVNEGSFFFAQNREDAAAYSSIGQVLQSTHPLRDATFACRLASGVWAFQSTHPLRGATQAVFPACP